MNRFIYSAIILLLLINTTSFQAVAQKEPYEMMVRGVKVIVQPSNNDIVQVVTVFKGGVRNYSLEKAGIENLAIKALTECGTTNDDKNTFKNKLDRVSGQIYGNAGMDYSTLSMNCIKGDLDVVWTLYADALVHPKFDEKEFERIKQDAINSIKERESQPDYAIAKLAKTTAFAGMNYAKEPTGNEASVKTISSSEAKKYYDSLAVKSKIFFVVVADLDQNEIQKRIEKVLETLPEGKPYTFKPEYFSAKNNRLKSEKKDLATNYIQAVASGPAPGSKDYNAFLLAMRIFYDRHFLEIRTNNGLSYAPGTYFDGGLTPSANIVVSTTDPNKYKTVFNKLLTKTRSGFTEEEVRNMKTTYITSHYYRQETNAAQANSLASNEVLHNNWRRTMTLNDDLKNITAKDVSAAFNKYLTNMVWVYQGDPAKVNPLLYTQTSAKPSLPPSSLSTKKTNK